MFVILHKQPKEALGFHVLIFLYFSTTEKWSATQEVLRTIRGSVRESGFQYLSGDVTQLVECMHEALSLAWHKVSMAPHTCNASATDKVKTGEWKTQGYPQLDIVWRQSETLSQKKYLIPKITFLQITTKFQRVPQIWSAPWTNLYKMEGLGWTRWLLRCLQLKPGLKLSSSLSLSWEPI